MRNRLNWLGVALAAMTPVFAGCSADSGGVGPGSPDSSPADDANPVSDAKASDTSVRDGSAGDTGAGCSTDGGAPNDLSATGLYSNWAAKTIATNVIPYTPSFQLWSDGAQNSRWIYLPLGSQIDTTDMDNWVFPMGTKIWMQFSVGGKIIETRLLSKTCTDWSLLDYRWSTDMTSATLLMNGESHVNGTTYQIPSTFECNQCHSGRNDFVLGFDLIGLGAPGAVGITLADLVTQGRLTRPPPATVVKIPEDATGKAAQALGYLHMNCGASCHNSLGGGASATGLYLKLVAGQLYPPDGGTASVSKIDTYTTSVNVPGIVLTQYMRIKPKDAANSLIPLLAGARDTNDAGQFPPMPPLITHQVDAAGLAAIQAWINAL